MAIAPQRTGIGIRRHFTTEACTPTTRSRWERRDSRITELPRRDGRLRAARRRGSRHLEHERHEHPGPEVLPGHARHAGAGVVAQAGRRPGRRHASRPGGSKDGYFVDDAEAETFSDELKHLIVHQKAAFNSPVWFNIGVRRRSRSRARRASSSPSRTRWTRSSTGTPRRGPSSRAAPAPASTCRSIRSSHELLEGRRHRVGPGQLHARRRRVGRDDQVRRQDPAGGEDGDPRRRPPRHRGLHLVQGHRGAQGPGPPRRRVRHGPRRRGQPLDPVPERQQLGPGHRRVHAGGRRRRRLGPDGADRRVGRCGRSGPGTSSARSPTRPGSAPTRGCSSTRRSTTGTPRRTPVGSTAATRARSTCTSTTRRATWPASTC